MLSYCLIPLLLLPFLTLPPSLSFFLSGLSLIILTLVLRLRCLGRRIRRPTLAFFHPYCNAGGGGERVLWQCVLSVLKEYPAASVYIYTGDTDASSQQIISNAENCFGLQIPGERVEFIYLKTRVLVEAKCYPVCTLLGQSLGSMVLGFEALCRFQPAYFVDTMGYAFTYFYAELCGCDVLSYVHYPTISTDMLGKVASREESFNNSSLVAHNPLLSRLKLLYYRMFARLYSYMGSKSLLVFVNSSWTRGHVEELWKINEKTFLLYPPCNTEKYLNIPSGPRSKRIVSVSQFRPEKNHALQIRSFALFVDKTGRRDVTLTLVGGVRNQEDRDRVGCLRERTKSMGIEDLVEFKISIPYEELFQILSDSLIGLHTMENEHFGISVVELQAAGVISVAHNSGGPKLDIVAPGTGFLAVTEEEYSVHMMEILEMDEEEREDMRVRARHHVRETFSDTSFRQQFMSQCLDEAGVDLRWIMDDDKSEEEESEEEQSENDGLSERLSE